jgi:hypothetical protein
MILLDMIRDLLLTAVTCIRMGVTVAVSAVRAHTLR